ncbi:MAG TPA: cytochrome c-type biogenesis protein [Devosia sp.]|nr:cytochrome c-type biogenesis protein [Devosia sp.]
MKRLAGLLVALVLALAPAAAFAVNPDEMLSDPKLEARAEAIGQSLRCLVCQNESIEASDADLAHDLRVLVRERLKAGDTDDQARQYIVDRYGEFVLLQPVFALHTLLLWFAAPALAVIGIVALVVLARRRRNVSEPAELTAEEAEILERLSAPEHPAGES